MWDGSSSVDRGGGGGGSGLLGGGPDGGGISLPPPAIPLPVDADMMRYSYSFWPTGLASKDFFES